ncbi:MAG TPA: tRNA preQ1(34) S-adenosylmethionine ribosyltransferase-isomerase QueA [Chloroflexota bacterium]|nr:tRNA preQ1(34) S-adenosylmethionine ribosyltransferase-isomerase QueA [Chloroflexota bacterium]
MEHGKASASSDSLSAHALSGYDYALPSELIAQTPAEPRDSARLLVLDRATGHVEHRHVFDLPSLLSPGDVVVANRSRVVPCRIHARKADSGGAVEILLLRSIAPAAWLALTRAHRLRTGQQLIVDGEISLEVGEAVEGARVIHFPSAEAAHEVIQRWGEVPLPPYIRAYAGDPNRYQTVYADVEGSSAAPTAGLHFTPSLIEQVKSRGAHWAMITLHIGLDTFKPIAVEDLRQHHIHTEWIDVPADTVELVDRARREGGRVVAVGTTTVRALEHAAASGDLRPCQGWADLFITPGYRFRSVDVMLTNFHLPKSSLLLLVSAFAGRERILSAYREAVAERYRFYSFGDAMLIR